MTGPTWGGMPHRNARHDPCTKETKQSWDLGHPPQKHERAVWVHVGFTLLLFALAPASPLQCAREALGGRTSAGYAGGASSGSRSAPRGSCVPQGTMASCISLKTRGGGA
jgi:uncharacterized membrane protein